ncbi:MAG: PKD domain-containing protein [Owenweeksia sp.]|nr:PKD domain-containing protein [Owenweeksia sp.]
MAIDTQRVYVMVGTSSNVTWFPSRLNFCASEAPHSFSGYSPAGGYFSGPGVSGTTFDPGTAGIGEHEIYYIYQDGGCTDTAVNTLTVLNTPSATLNTNGTLSTFFGQQVYSRCVPSSSDFIFSTTTIDSTYNSFVLDFGDGTTPLTGTSFPSPYVSHNYSSSGFYTVSLTMSNGIGCSHTTSMRIYYGSNPSVGLSIKGNNVKCLPNDSSGITFFFSYWQLSVQLSRYGIYRRGK